MMLPNGKEGVGLRYVATTSTSFSLVTVKPLRWLRVEATIAFRSRATSELTGHFAQPSRSLALPSVPRHLRYPSSRFLADFVDGAPDITNP